MNIVNLLDILFERMSQIFPDKILFLLLISCSRTYMFENNNLRSID